MSRGHVAPATFAGFYYCLRCGLVFLKNTVSRKAVSKPCPGKEEGE